MFKFLEPNTAAELKDYKLKKSWDEVAIGQASAENLHELFDPRVKLHIHSLFSIHLLYIQIVSMISHYTFANLYWQSTKSRIIDSQMYYGALYIHYTFANV